MKKTEDSIVRFFDATFPYALKQRIRQIASIEGVNMTDVVRTACTDYCHKNCADIDRYDRALKAILSPVRRCKHAGKEKK